MVIARMNLMRWRINVKESRLAASVAMLCYARARQPLLLSLPQVTWAGFCCVCKRPLTLTLASPPMAKKRRQELDSHVQMVHDYMTIWAVECTFEAKFFLKHVRACIRCTRSASKSVMPCNTPLTDITDKAAGRILHRGRSTWKAFIGDAKVRQEKLPRIG